MRKKLVSLNQGRKKNSFVISPSKFTIENLSTDKFIAESFAIERIKGYVKLPGQIGKARKINDLCSIVSPCLNLYGGFQLTSVFSHFTRRYETLVKQEKKLKVPKSLKNEWRQSSRLKTVKVVQVSSRVNSSEPIDTSLTKRMALLNTLVFEPLGKPSLTIELTDYLFKVPLQKMGYTPPKTLNDYFRLYRHCETDSIIRTVILHRISNGLLHQESSSESAHLSYSDLRKLRELVFDQFIKPFHDLLLSNTNLFPKGWSNFTIPYLKDCFVRNANGTSISDIIKAVSKLKTQTKSLLDLQLDLGVLQDGLIQRSHIKDCIFEVKAKLATTISNLDESVRKNVGVAAIYQWALDKTTIDEPEKETFKTIVILLANLDNAGVDPKVVRHIRTEISTMLSAFFQEPWRYGLEQMSAMQFLSDISPLYVSETPSTIPDSATNLQKTSPDTLVWFFSALSEQFIPIQNASFFFEMTTLLSEKKWPPAEKQLKELYDRYIAPGSGYLLDLNIDWHTVSNLDLLMAVEKPEQQALTSTATLLMNCFNKISVHLNNLLAQLQKLVPTQSNSTNSLPLKITELALEKSSTPIKHKPSVVSVGETMFGVLIPVETLPNSKDRTITQINHKIGLINARAQQLESLKSRSRYQVLQDVLRLLKHIVALMKHIHLLKHQTKSVEGADTLLQGLATLGSQLRVALISVHQSEGGFVEVYDLRDYRPPTPSTQSNSEAVALQAKKFFNAFQELLETEKKYCKQVEKAGLTFSFKVTTQINQKLTGPQQVTWQHLSQLCTSFVKQNPTFLGQLSTCYDAPLFHKKLVNVAKTPQGTPETQLLAKTYNQLFQAFHTIRRDLRELQDFHNNILCQDEEEETKEAHVVKQMTILLKVLRKLKTEVQQSPKLINLITPISELETFIAECNQCYEQNGTGSWLAEKLNKCIPLYKKVFSMQYWISDIFIEDFLTVLETHLPSHILLQTIARSVYQDSAALFKQNENGDDSKLVIELKKSIKKSVEQDTLSSPLRLSSAGGDLNPFRPAFQRLARYELLLKELSKLIALPHISPENQKRMFVLYKRLSKTLGMINILSPSVDK